MTAPADLYQRFELEVRTPKKKTPLDVFLPPPESLDSSVPVVSAPLEVPEMTPEEANMYRRREPDEAPEASEPEPKPKKKAAKKKKEKAESSLSLQDEIAEFMNRGNALAPEEDKPLQIDIEPARPDPDPEKKD